MLSQPRKTFVHIRKTQYINNKNTTKIMTFIQLNFLLYECFVAHKKYSGHLIVVEP